MTSYQENQVVIVTDRGSEHHGRRGVITRVSDNGDGSQYAVVEIQIDGNLFPTSVALPCSMLSPADESPSEPTA
jgi:hypothetical protein